MAAAVMDSQYTPPLPALLHYVHPSCMCTFICFLRSARSRGITSSNRNLYCLAKVSCWKALPPMVGSKRGSLPPLHHNNRKRGVQEEGEVFCMLRC